jgi:hypothetical protein
MQQPHGTKLMRLLIAMALLCAALPAWADVSPKPGDATNAPSIALPGDADDYSRLVAQAAAGDQATDFRALRFSWLDSKARERHSEISLRPNMTAMLEATKAGNDQLVRGRAVALLSDEYVNLTGQQYLFAACDKIGDKPCTEQAKFVARGLVQSILRSGDGKTCESGWEVAMVEEEYAVLRIMGMQPRQQALIMGKNGGHSCDAMTVIDKDGKEVTQYFTIDRVMADEMKMFKIK